jgi:hypothetical protein
MSAPGRLRDLERLPSVCVGESREVYVPDIQAGHNRATGAGGVRRVQGIPCLILAIVVALHGVSASTAVGPRLALKCGPLAVRTVIVCRLTGFGFSAHESVHVSYHLKLGVSWRKYRNKLYAREAHTGQGGSFSLPPLRFTVVRGDFTYELKVIARGTRGDHATALAHGVP